MSDKTNEEKLRILQERLAQIKEKKDASSTITNSIEKDIEIANHEMEDPLKAPKKRSFKWLKYFVLSFCIVFGTYYAYNNIDFKASTSNKIEANKIDPVEKIPVEKITEYNLELEGDNIVITGTFADESAAKAMVNTLKVKGFKSDYFYLPNKSNNTEKSFKVFIGPYEHEEETNQWIENLEMDFEIIPL